MSRDGRARETALRQLLRPLGPFLEDPAVTEVAVNRPREVWSTGGRGWRRHEVAELPAEHLRALTTAIAVYNGLSTDGLLSAILPDGERCQIVREPACVAGWTPITIRKHAPLHLTLKELEEQGAFRAARDVSFFRPSEAEAAALLDAQGIERLEPVEVELLRAKREGRHGDLLRGAVRHRRNVIIAGATGSGKTTLARALVAEVPPEERVITIEDVHELDLPGHPNRVPLLYGVGQGRVTAEGCLAACMRLTPDRIFLAELRGPEAWEYVTSLNTGHPGSVTTTHANSAVLTVERVAMLIRSSEAGRNLDLGDVRRVLHSTLHLVLFMEDRRVTEVLYDPVHQQRQLR